MERSEEQQSGAVVLGMGNELLRDEGVGIHVLRALQQRGLPPRTTLIEAGTATDALWDELVLADRLVVVDAVRGGGPPAAVYRFQYKADMETNGPAVSGHEVGLKHKLAALQLLGCEVPDVVVIGIEPAVVEPGLGLSPEVQEKVPTLVELVLNELDGALPETAVSMADGYAGGNER